MNEMMTFRNLEFGAIRTMSNEQGEPMFCAKDVCLALNHTNSRKAVSDLVDKDDVTRSYIVDSLGRKNHAIFINESGLYALILSSKLESARRFKHWVTSEVLPSIRKQGGYMVARPDETDRKCWLVPSKSCRQPCKAAYRRARPRDAARTADVG